MSNYQRVPKFVDDCCMGNVLNMVNTWNHLFKNLATPNSGPLFAEITGAANVKLRNALTSFMQCFFKNFQATMSYDQEGFIYLFPQSQV